MVQDRYGLRHTAASPEALAAFGEAVHGVAAHRPSTGEALKRALSADPHLVAAHALKGFANLMLAREELVPAASRAYADALASRLVKGRATASERALTEALSHAVEGRFLAAAQRLDAHLDESPREFLPAKIAHALRFMAGDLDGMLVGTARVIDAWRPDAPGYGFLLGCHAFALEEKGELEAAERIGRRAVEIEPLDAWGLHAVSHVHEMQGRVDEGLAWLEGSRPVWKACNNFGFHMAWHLALFHLERGDHERVLAVYDAEVRPHSTDDFRDMANAVSILWRLEQEGVAVGDRWDEVRAVATARQRDTTLTFACLHNLLALVATGDAPAAGTLAASMGERGIRGEPGPDRGDQAVVMDAVGRDLSGFILSLARPSGAPLADVAFGRIAGRLQRIGGSHAQRDVFLRTLAHVAADRGDARSVEQVLAVRRRIKRDDRFAALVHARLADRLGGLRHSA